MTRVERLLSRLFKHVDIVKNGKVYLRRWFIVDLGKYKIYLHKIFMSDDDLNPHDHPWDFTTLVVRNGYDDVSYNVGDFTFGERLVDRLDFFSIRHRKAEHRHEVKKFNDEPTWTLVLRGPYRRRWGFIENATSVAPRWIFWREYLDFWGVDPYDPESYKFDGPV